MSEPGEDWQRFMIRIPGHFLYLRGPEVHQLDEVVLVWVEDHGSVHRQHRDRELEVVHDDGPQEELSKLVPAAHVMLISSCPLG